MSLKSELTEMDDRVVVSAALVLPPSALLPASVVEADDGGYG